MRELTEEERRAGSSGELSICDILKEEWNEKLKWLALIMACSITIGSYYIYDFPGSIGNGPEHTIEARFAAHGQEYTQGMNLALYSVYSWPNTVLAVVGGVLIDKFLGLRRSMLLFCGLVMVGSCIFWIGTAVVNYVVIVLGRLIFGLGAECLTVSQSAFIARWFAAPKRGLSFAFALGVAFSRVGSSFNFLFSPMISKNIGVTTATFVGFCMCVFSFGCCVALVILDKKGSEQGLVKDEPAKTDDKKEGSSSSSPALSCDNLKQLPPQMWVIGLICMFAYCAIFPFTSIAENFFEVKYGLAHDVAGQSISLFQGLSAGGLPIGGIIVDVLGRHCYFLIASLLGIGGIHVLFLAVSLPPELMMSLFALFYSIMVSSLWTTVPFTVPETVNGFAYGVMTALQNFGLAVFPLIVGAILDAYTPAGDSPVAPAVTNHTDSASSSYSSSSSSVVESPTGTTAAALPTLPGYRLALLVLLGSAAAASLLAIFLFISDKRRTGILSASPAARAKITSALKEHEVPLVTGSGEDETENEMSTAQKFRDEGDLYSTK